MENRRSPKRSFVVSTKDLEHTSAQSQIINVLVIADNKVETDETFTMTLTALSTNGRDVTLSDSVGVGTILNDDFAGITIIQSAGSTNVTEGSTIADSYTLVLNSQPTANVTITVTADEQLTIGQGSSILPLVFTALNWNIPQTVTVLAVDDTIEEGLHTGTISQTANSSDSNYNGLAITDVVVNITDNDLLVVEETDLQITKTATPSIVEAGQPITFILAYTNISTGTASDVVISDMIPAEVTNVSIQSNPSATLIGTLYTWQLGDLAPDMGGIITITGTIDPGLSSGVFTNTATISSTTTDINLSNNSAQVAITVTALDGSSRVYLPMVLK